MQRYQGWIQDKQGNAIEGVQIAVYIAGSTTNLAVIYQPNGSRTAPAPRGNPFTTDALGFYSFAAGNGIYDIQISGGSIPTLTIPNVILYDNLDTSPSPALGTVTSVGLSLPSILTVSGSPVTGAGTLSATLASQTANFVFAAPNGSAGAPSFRSLVSGDLPTTGTPGVYGSVTQLPQVTVDAYGRVTSVSMLTVAPAFSSVTAKPTTMSGYGITDGASINVANAWTKGQNVQIVSYSPAAAGTVTHALTDSNVIYIQMPAGNITLANFTGTTSGASGVAATVTVIVKQDGVGSRTISYGGKFKFPSASVYQPDATASAISAVYCQYEPNNDIWLCSGVSKYS